jgi:divalent metal cation (Fe/Co/Zn/Cd) transporter
MEIRIGVVHTPKELSVELDGSLDDLKQAIETALTDDDGVLWLDDTRGRIVGVPSQRIAYVEIEMDGSSKRVGFGRG